MPKVSVIIPIYNAEKYLAECLENIIRQTLNDVEIVCVNDGSTDATPEILQQFSTKDNRIKIFSQSNQGAGTAKNVGLREASGEFVAFMGADDFYHDAQVLQRLYDLALAHQVPVCGGGMKIIQYAKNDHSREKSASFDNFACTGLVKYMDYQCSTGYVRYIFNRQMILDNNILFPDTRRGQDYMWCIRALLAARVFYAADFPVYVYRQNHKSSTYPYHVMLEMLESELLAMRLADENNLEKIKQYHETRLLKHTREMLLSHPATGEISAHYTRSFFRYYCLKFLARLLPGKLGRLYRDKFLAYKTPFNTVRRNRLY